MKEKNLVTQTACLPEVVRSHHDLGTGRMNRQDDPLDLRGGTGIDWGTVTDRAGFPAKDMELIEKISM